MNYFTWYWKWGNLILGTCIGRVGRPGGWHVSLHLLFLTVAFGNVLGGFIDEDD